MIFVNLSLIALFIGSYLGSLTPWIIRSVARGLAFRRADKQIYLGLLEGNLNTESDDLRDKLSRLYYIRQELFYR